MRDIYYYLGLVTPFHSTRPKYMNMLAVLLQPLCDAQALLEALVQDFDLDTAIGVQLDVLGQWIGRTRYIEQPISGVFFCFDDSGGPRTGFDYGVWLGKYDPTDAITALDDETYRSVLKLQALANQWDGTLSSIANAFNIVFPGAVIHDLGDQPTGLMSMEVLIPKGQLSSLMLGVLEQDFPLKPSGVHMTIVESTLTGTPIFGFDIDDTSGTFGVHIAGFDHGSWAEVLFVA